jgi:glycosyltransferase involved in cell wall biosynthesis
MHVLFLHPNFPAQFRYLASVIASKDEHRAVFATARKEGSLPNVIKAIYAPARLERAVLEGQAVFRAALEMKKQGFDPRLIYAHSGWGPSLFMKEVFPKAKLLCYFEWFYHPQGSDADFDPAEPLNIDDRAFIRTRNAPILLDLQQCNQGLCPTEWQKSQFPKEFQDKLAVLHDGVDTVTFQPQPGAKLVLPRIGLDLSEAKEVVTYVARGMEPYRGFPQFIEALRLLQKQRPQCHAVIVGEERVAYGRQLPEGESWKKRMLEKVELDHTRVHFTGYLSVPEYLQVLQASSVHVYLTRPFVLSWSMLEAMATGCAIVASNTAPVLEVIEDGRNGVLTDFFSPEQIAERVVSLLDDPERRKSLAQAARETILERYSLEKLLPKQLQWMQDALELETKS